MQNQIKPTKILIVQAIFYQDISKMLLDGAIEELNKSNITFDIINLSGALEIPVAIAITLEKQKHYDGFVALGCVIRGETSHYETVCQESARGLMDLAINKAIAIGNGIITVENEEQAFERADKSLQNKGGFAVKACLDLIKLLKN
jgi:6,7-dimethyl-8-ribityllumazine synthase